MKRLFIFLLVSALSIFALSNLVSASSDFQSTGTPSVTTTGTRTPSPTATRTGTSTATLTYTATSTVSGTRTLTTTATITASVTVTATPTISATQTPTTTPTITPTPTMTGTPTPTPIKYPLSLDPNVLSIDALRARPYGGSGIKITKTVATNEAYKQVLIEYSSDGLKITGTMNIPRGLGPFPVVILDHGYFKPSEYKTGDGSSRAADAFARHGYLTIAPDYRCYAGSQCGSNPFYIGYAIDVLNLIAQVSTVPDADVTRIGIWGHSMGGEITLRVLAINDDLKVAALYGALTGDDQVHYCWLIGCRTPTVPTAPTREAQLQLQRVEIDPDFLQSIPAPVASNDNGLGKLHDIFLKSSASHRLANITAPVIIHHGEADDIVPIEWSVDLANSLTALGKTAQLYTYPGETHVFAGWGWQLFMTRTLSFFDEYLKPRESIVTADQRVLMQERIAAEQSY